MENVVPKIGSLTLENPLILAPMAGVTHQPFRLLCRRMKAGLVCSEMVSAKGLAYRNERSIRMLSVAPAEKPVSVQIFGSQPLLLARAAADAQEAGADIVDVNFGCSVNKVLKTGAGAALMADMPRSRDILRAIRAAVTCPVSVKMRSGWDPSGNQALALARLAVDCGVDLLAVHPRTVDQGFSGQADWGLIAAVKRTVPIPVAGSGDVARPEDAPAMMRATGCDFVMIGRAARRAPWIFSQALDVLAGREPVEPSPALRREIMLGCLDDLAAHFGEFLASLMMRGHLPALTRGLPGGRPFRESFVRVKTLAEAREAIEEFFRAVEATAGEPPG